MVVLQVVQGHHRSTSGERGAFYLHLIYSYQLDATLCEEIKLQMADELDTDRIKDWRSIITLIVFVLASKALALFATYMSDYHRYRRALPLPRPHIHSSLFRKCDTTGTEYTASD